MAAVPMSADRLRAAARKIDDAASAAWDVDTSQAGWHTHEGMAQMLSDAGVAWPSEDAAYIALMAPPVGLAMAKLLTEIAAMSDTFGMSPTAAESIADLILGGSS